MCFHSDIQRFSRRAWFSREGEKLQTIRVWSTFTHHRPPYDRHHNQEGVGLNFLWHIHLPTILLCTRVIRSTNTCTPASTMIPQTSQSAPVTSGQIVSALSMPSAKQLVAFWAVVASWEMESQFTAWSDQPLVTLLPHTFLHTPTKEVPPASSKKVTVFCGVFIVYII